jgi:hypothetical protein
MKELNNLHVLSDSEMKNVRGGWGYPKRRTLIVLRSSKVVKLSAFGRTVSL